MKIIIITGQTATGKTKLALDYLKKGSAQLVNADSRQIYKNLDIVSGKDLVLISQYKTHLFDIKDPKEYFSSFEWAKFALKVIQDLFKKGITPVVAGGTYLYLYHLLYGIDTEGIGPDWELRKELENVPVEKLQQILEDISPQSFNRLNQSDRNNPQRLMRKIEIAKMGGGKDQSTLKFEQIAFFKKLPVKLIGLRYDDNAKLRKAIEKRVDERIGAGAFEEVKSLLEKGYDERDPGLRTIGYQELIKYYTGTLSKEEAIYLWTAKEIQYAKRQYIFMKRDPHIEWNII